MSIVLENLTKTYGTQNAIDQLNLEIKSGEIVGFLGPNGAGKSTTMKIISCFLPQTSGKAIINGNDTLTHSALIRQELGYLPEHNPLYLDMYVHEYLLFIASIYNIKGQLKHKVSEIIEKTGLVPEQNKKIKSLSKGYRQRVGLAQALIHNPKVLILDEPTSGLDPNQILEIRKLILEFGQERTIMLSTHIMQEVEALCNRVIIINKGKLVADDSVKNLQKQFLKTTQITVEFKDKCAIENLKTISNILKIEQTSDHIFKIDTSNPIETKEALFNIAVKNNTIIVALNEQQSSLEEVFHQLTK